MFLPRPQAQILMDLSVTTKKRSDVTLTNAMISLILGSILHSLISDKPFIHGRTHQRM